MKRPTIGTVYAVYWPAEQVLKVGIMWRDSRIRHMVDTGGEVLGKVARERREQDPRRLIPGPQVASPVDRHHGLARARSREHAQRAGQGAGHRPLFVVESLEDALLEQLSGH